MKDNDVDDDDHHHPYHHHNHHCHDHVKIAECMLLIVIDLSLVVSIASLFIKCHLVCLSLCCLCLYRPYHL